MKSRTLYSIFFLLGVLVLGMVFITYRYAGTLSSSHLSETPKQMIEQREVQKMSNQYALKNTWLGRVDVKNQKNYTYAILQQKIRLD